MVKRREMLRAGFSKVAQVLPLALAATGFPGRLLQVGAGSLPPREAASFPAARVEGAGNSQEMTKEED